jgi:prepilin-type N-terminal cleavage/methylation domain-containing protein
MPDTSPSERNETGFTLIELLIVTLVIGILAGIVLLAVGTFEDDAARTRGVANDKQCATLIAGLTRDGVPPSWEQVADYFEEEPPGRCGLSSAALRPGR